MTKINLKLEIMALNKQLKVFGRNAKESKWNAREKSFQLQFYHIENHVVPYKNKEIIYRFKNLLSCLRAS